MNTNKILFDKQPPWTENMTNHNMWPFKSYPCIIFSQFIIQNALEYFITEIHVF